MTTETLQEVIAVPWHVCPHGALKSPKSTPMDKVENECQREAGNSLRTQSKAGTSAAVGHRPESQPVLRRMMCDHLPEAPVHRGLQGAQAAQGDPEKKAKQHQCQVVVENGFKHSFNKPVQSSGHGNPMAEKRGFLRSLPGELMLLGVFGPLQLLFLSL